MRLCSAVACVALTFVSNPESHGTKAFLDVQGAATTEGAAGTEPVAADLDKAKALGNALLICMALPWFLCFVFYSGAAHAFPI